MALCCPRMPALTLDVVNCRSTTTPQNRTQMDVLLPPMSLVCPVSSSLLRGIGYSSILMPAPDSASAGPFLLVRSLCCIGAFLLTLESTSLDPSVLSRSPSYLELLSSSSDLSYMGTPVALRLCSHIELALFLFSISCLAVFVFIPELLCLNPLSPLRFLSKSRPSLTVLNAIQIDTLAFSHRRSCAEAVLTMSNVASPEFLLPSRVCTQVRIVAIMSSSIKSGSVLIS